MTLESIARRAISARDWDAVVHDSPDGWVFGLYGWQELIIAVERWGLKDFSFALRENGRLVAVVPLQLNPNSGVMASSGWSGVGPVLDGKLAERARRRIMGAAIAQCAEVAERCGARRFEISLSPVTQTSISIAWGVNPLVMHGLEDRSGLSRVVDLTQPEEQLWAGLSYDARRQIRLARERGYVAERADWSACLDHYYALHCENYRRTGVEPHPRAYFAGITEHTAPGGYSVLWRVRDASGVCVAYHNDACFRNGAYYHTGCSANGAGETGAGYLLFWEAVMGARAAGVRWYDVGDVFPGVAEGKQRGLTIFKSKFGGELHRIFRGAVDITASPQLALPELETRVEAARQWLRATRRLISAFAGEPVAVRLESLVRRSIAPAARAKRFFVQLTRGTLRPVPFLRPYWKSEELRIGRREVSDSENARQELACRLRQVLSIPRGDEIVLTGSGRTAMELCLKVLKDRFPERRKVLIPSYGCRGTFDPIVQAGLTPVFVDVGGDLLPDTEDIMAQMDPSVLACLIVHMCGRKMEVRAVADAAERLGITLIEDACLALGLGPAPSTSFRLLSFGMGKSAMASAGGALIASALQNEVRQAASALREEPLSASMNRFSFFVQRYFVPSARPSVAALAAEHLTQYGQVKMSARDAEIMTCQIDRLAEILDRRHRNAEELRPSLERRPDLFRLQSPGPNTYTKLAVTLRDPELAADFRAHMAQWGIELEEMYVPLHERSFASAYRTRDLPYSETLKYRVLNVPVRPNLSVHQVRCIRRAIDDFSAATK